jgi:predicted methyltransferase
MRLIAATLLLLAATATSIGAPTAIVQPYIARAVADPSRPKDDRDLDAMRKPSELLAYAGVKPGQVVGEYLPGGGYYTRLLSDIARVVRSMRSRPCDGARRT